VDNYKHIKISDLIFHRNAHKISRNKNIEELSKHIKVYGLLNPIIVTENGDGKYEIISGIRRFFAVKELLNWDKIPCHVISVDSAEDVQAILLGEHLTTCSASIGDLSNMFNDLFSEFGDVRIAAQKFGISEKLFRKYVKFRRLPPLVQENIDKIDPNPNTAVRLGLVAVDLLNWSPDSDVPAEKILEVAILLGEKK
jgi:ParB/RepB/Spo0J family partition protein